MGGLEVDGFVFRILDSGDGAEGIGVEREVGLEVAGAELGGEGGLPDDCVLGG